MTYYGSMTQMVIPLLGLLQLGMGGFFAFVSPFLFTHFDLRMGFIFSIRHTIVCLCFLVLSIYTKQLQLFNKAQAPFLLITSLAGVFLNGQLYTVS